MFYPRNNQPEGGLVDPFSRHWRTGFKRSPETDFTNNDNERSGDRAINEEQNVFAS